MSDMDEEHIHLQVPNLFTYQEAPSRFIRILLHFDCRFRGVSIAAPGLETVKFRVGTSK